jgi:murein DD-endopeptidase MepM/ murein hydrolase activator NlpD
VAEIPTTPAEGRAGKAAARLLRLAVVAALLAVGVWFARPWLEKAVRFVRLLQEEPPRSLPVPVDGVAPGRLTDTWGAARDHGRSHEGIDIFAPRGTPVRSATHGLVSRKGWNRLGGRTVTVTGPGGQRHYYAHLESWTIVEPGDWVEAGDQLGTVGSSGNARDTPPHLHYGIYAGDGARNPYPLLTAGPEDVPAVVGP